MRGVYQRVMTNNTEDSLSCCNYIEKIRQEKILHRKLDHIPEGLYDTHQAYWHQHLCNKVFLAGYGPNTWMATTWNEMGKNYPIIVGEPGGQTS